MVIRTSQIATFRDHANRTFEDEIITHLVSFAPELCGVIGSSGIREAVRLGLNRAREYGFTNRGPARFYVELMFTFGSSFDTDPQLPWARVVLNNLATDQMLRANQLYDAMEEYLHDVAGPQNGFAFEALQRLKSVRLDSMPEQGDVARVIRQALQSTYPQKYAYVGEVAIAQLIYSAAKVARDLGLPAGRGVGVLTGLMFGFGHGILHDPLYPWVRRTLEDPLITGSQGRIERLEAKLWTYVDAMLSRFGPLSNA